LTQPTQPPTPTLNATPPGSATTRASALLHGAAIRRKSNSTAARRGSTSSQLVGAADAPERLQLGAALDPDDASSASFEALAALAATPSPAMLERAEQILATSHEWQFDAFALAEATQGHPLSTLAFYLFQREDLVGHFGINPVTLARCGWGWVRSLGGWDGLGVG